MKSRGFNVFKCIVNISSQDFGVYFRGKVNPGVGSKVEQHGIGEASVLELEDEVVELQTGVGGVEWRFWALVVFLEMIWWLVGLRSLLGWLWWRWEVAWAGNCDLGAYDNKLAQSQCARGSHQ